MARMTGTGVTPARVFTIAGVTALVIAVLALVMLALQTGEQPGEAVERGSAEALLPKPVDTPEPTPEPELPPPVTPGTARLAALTADTDVLWRTTGGECVAGEAVAAIVPSIERAEDVSTWIDVTPQGLDLRAVAFLEVISETAAEAVVLLGPDCEPQVIRTFTNGNFWEPYDESLVGAVYVSPDRTQIITTDAPLPAPCALPRTPSGQNERVTAIVCEGSLQWWQADAWSAQELPGVLHAAEDAETSTVVTATLYREGCEGALLQRWANPATLVGEYCATGLTTATLFASPNETWVWHAGGVEKVTI